MKTQAKKEKFILCTAHTYGKLGVGSIKVKVSGRYEITDVAKAIAKRLDLEPQSRPVWVGNEGTKPGKVYVNQYMVDCKEGVLEFSLTTRAA